MIDKLPTGTRLKLEPRQWRSSPGVPGRTQLRIDVLQTFASHDPAWVWVYGHGWDCGWESVECPQPFCVEILVHVGAIESAVVPR